MWRFILDCTFDAALDIFFALSIVMELTPFHEQTAVKMERQSSLPEGWWQWRGQLESMLLLLVDAVMAMVRRDRRCNRSMRILM